MEANYLNNTLSLSLRVKNTFDLGPKYFWLVQKFFDIIGLFNNGF